VLVCSHIEQIIDVLIKGETLHTALVQASDTVVSRGILKVIFCLINTSSDTQMAAVFKHTLCNVDSGLAITCVFLNHLKPKAFKSILLDLSSNAVSILGNKAKQEAKPLELIFVGVPEPIKANK